MELLRKSCYETMEVTLKDIPIIVYVENFIASFFFLFQIYNIVRKTYDSYTTKIQSCNVLFIRKHVVKTASKRRMFLTCLAVHWKVLCVCLTRQGELKALESDHYCWGARILLTVLKVNPQNYRCGSQRTISAEFLQNFKSISLGCSSCLLTFTVTNTSIK